MSKLTYLVLLLFVACTPSVQVVDRPVPVPEVRIDTVYVGDYGPFYGPSVCDTAAILDALCHGSASGETDGVKWKIEYDKVSRAFTYQGIVIRQLRDSVHLFVNKPSDTIWVKDTTRVTVVQEWGWWDKVQFGATFIVAGFLLAVGAYILLKIKGLVG